MYFGVELVINGLIPSLNYSDSIEDRKFDPWSDIIQQYYDMVVIFALLLVFRPRVWPEYFSIGLLEGEDSSM